MRQGPPRLRPLPRPREDVPPKPDRASESRRIARRRLELDLEDRARLELITWGVVTLVALVGAAWFAVSGF